MNGINVFLNYLSDNWVGILVSIGLAIILGKQIANYNKMGKRYQVAIVKQQLQEIMLKLVEEAEMEFSLWEKSGEIKRAQVISEIYKRYPILSKVVEQEEIINWIDMQIDDSLEVLRGIIKGKSEEE